MKADKQGRVKAAGVLLMTRSRPQQFLLMRHPRRWDLPKGHCDAGEGFLEAAKRELEEETGIAAKHCRFDPDFRFDLTYEVTYKKFPGETFEKTVRYFLATIDRAVNIKVTEHDDYQWFEWSPPHQIQTQTIDPLLQHVAQHLQNT